MLMRRILFLYIHFILEKWLRYIAIFLYFHSLFHLAGKNNHYVMETMVTEDSISLFLHGVVNLSPLVQVYALNQVNPLKSSSIRFQISILDDIHKHELILLVIYSHLVENGQLKQETIIKITQCSCNIVYNITYVQFPLSFPINQFHTVHRFNVCLAFMSNILHLTGLSHWLHSRLWKWM